MRALVTAIRTLTIIPVPWWGKENPSGSLIFFPAVGLLIGLPVFFISELGAVMGWPSFGGALGVMASCAITGCLHMDGLADTFDSFGGRTREDKLRIMKDHSTGVYGVCAVVCSLMVKASAISALATYGMDRLVLVPFVVSRTMQVVIATMLPYARSEGGTGKPFVEGARFRHVAVALATGAVLCCAIGQVAGFAVFVLCLGGTGLLALWMRIVFGGVTGDLIGMTSETSEVLSFVVLGLMVQ